MGKEAPSTSADGAVSQIEQSLKIHEHPQPGENGNVGPELDMIMMGMPTAFNPKAAGDLETTIQYALSGEGGGMYHVHIKDGKCTAHHGPAVSRGEIDGQAAIMQGKYTVDGDFNLLLKLNEMFL